MITLSNTDIILCSTYLSRNDCLILIYYWEDLLPDICRVQHHAVFFERSGGENDIINTKHDLMQLMCNSDFSLRAGKSRGPQKIRTQSVVIMPEDRRMPVRRSTSGPKIELDLDHSCTNQTESAQLPHISVSGVQLVFPYCTLLRGKRKHHQ